MFTRKTVAGITAGFHKLVDDLNAVEQRACADAVAEADIMHAANVRRTAALAEADSARSVAANIRALLT